MMTARLAPQPQIQLTLHQPSQLNRLKMFFSRTFRTHGANNSLQMTHSKYRTKNEHTLSRYATPADIDGVAKLWNKRIGFLKKQKGEKPC